MAGLPESAQRELALLQKVDFRILNVANNERKLSELLGNYLAPVILKAASEHAAVRNEVIAICTRVKTFVEPPGVVLPVAKLVDQFQAVDSQLVRQLDMIFIRHSLKRITTIERRSLVPKLLRGISAKKSSTDGIFNVFLRSLPDIRIPPRGSQEDVNFAQEVGLEDPADAAYAAIYLGNLFILRVGADGSTAKTKGLSYPDVAFLTLNKDETWNPDTEFGLSLSETRILAARLLASGAFTDRDRILPAIFASASNDSRVASIGEDLLKRNTASLEDRVLVEDLLAAHRMYEPPYRIRILGLLSKSTAAATFESDILDVVKRNMLEAERHDPSLASFESVGGLVLTKLYRALFEFINWVARVRPKARDTGHGDPLVYFMQEYIETQGFPKPTSQASEQMSLRSRAYETIGSLAEGSYLPTTKRLDLAEWLFRALSEDTASEVVVNIDGALSSLMSSLRGPHDEETKQRLKLLLLNHIKLQEGEGGIVRSARHAVVKWANNCLPFSDTIGRWIDIVAIAGNRDERNDVIEEGRKGLDPWTYYAHEHNNNLEMPKWQEMVKIFFDSRSPQGSQEVPLDEIELATGSFTKVDVRFTEALDYCKQILFLTALGDSFKVEPRWESQLENLVHSDKQSRETIRSYLKSLDDSSLLTYLRAAQSGFDSENLELQEKAARCFVEILSLTPKKTVGELPVAQDRVISLIESNKKEIRTLGARALGILAPHPKHWFLPTLMTKMLAYMEKWSTAVGSELNRSEGAFLAMGYVGSRSFYYSPDQEAVEGILLSAEKGLPSIEQIASMSASCQNAIFDALIQLWTAGLPVLVKDQKGATELIDVLVTQAKKSNERAITALGRLAIARRTVDAADSEKIVSKIIEKLYELEEIKRTEVHFAVGEAITAAVACWDSDVVQLSLDIEDEDTSYRVGRRPELIQQVLDKLLENCKSTKPSLLKASGIWLFCLIQHCSHLPEIQEKLREVQVAFMRLLSARDELVQETASRGLSLVYDKGDASLKDALVKDLVASFTGSGPRLKVDEETELFDAGALPTGEGKSITSYKDIVNLANEVGDQSLVYKFMSLATNAATWSTRSAFGRFGLSNILSESEVDPKLYPKLYRYRFDPNQNVQKSMDDIWKALVKDSNAVLEEHFDMIMDDLLKSILGKEWRVRQASCGAVSELIQGRPFILYEKYYKDIWAKALKVLDDVKSSVREAALRLCINLSTTLVRQLEEGGSSKSAVAMMKEALPFLMSEKGMESGVEDVKMFCTVTVMKIAKNGGKALNVYAADMIVQLLGLLSTIEPDAVNYHYLRSGEDSREKIDKLRSAMVSQSPISEAIENCLRNIDGKVMAEMAPGLEGVIKSAIGMPTKIGCGRVLSTLATRHAVDFEPFSARFLQLMEKQALDKNDEVSQSYAKAAAYIMRVAPEEAKMRFVDRFTTLYFTSEDESRRQKVADAVLALSKISPDHFNALESKLLPFTYLAKHDTDEYVQKEFDEVWDKHAGTSRAVSRYVPEIVALVQRCLDTPQWALKHGGALTVAAMVKAVTSASDLTGQVNVSSLQTIWPVFDKAIALKKFPQKEKLLEALPDFVAKGKAFWQADAKVAAQLGKIATREAKRNNDAYRVHAFEALGKVAAAREDLDMLDEIVEIVGPHLEELRDEEDKMDVDKKAGSAAAAAATEDLVGKTAGKALEAIARGYSRPLMKEDSAAVLARIMKAVEGYLASREFDAIRRSVWYKAVLDLMTDASESVSAGSAAAGGDANLALKYFTTLDADKTDVGTEDQRSTRAKAIGGLLKALNKGSFGGGEHVQAQVEEIRKVVASAMTTDRSLEVQRLLRDALAETK